MTNGNQLTLLQLVAHRGNSRDFPENTLPALQSAVDLGLRLVEFDVQIAADFTPMVIHDDTLQRTADMEGSVFERTGSALSAIDVSERSRFGERHRGIRLPMLSTVVAWLERRPEITAFVEVKRASLRQFGHEPVMSAILKVIEPVRKQCVVISFDAPALEMARGAGFAVGWVLSAYDEIAHSQTQILEPDYVFCNHEKLSADGSHLWPGPWRWALYEVETVELAERLIARGAELIETMAVETLVRDLEKRACGVTTS